MKNDSPVGMIYYLQRYSLHDGQGIRSTVFFKGCPLRCKWCSNPESQSALPELFHDRTECAFCGKCISACDLGALRFSEDGSSLKRDATKCNSCFKCAEVCVNRALQVKGYLVDVQGLVKELLRDREFFEESGGGVTLTGGEPLAQPDFAASLLASLRESGIHTCVETCAGVSPEAFEKVASLADMIYCDIKHADDSKHKEFTGIGNEGIFRNLAFVQREGGNVVVRIPVIPGFNHDARSMEAIAERLAGIGVRKAELMSFHQLGEAKYRSLFRTCEMAGARQLRHEDIASYRLIFDSCGIDILPDE